MSDLKYPVGPFRVPDVPLGADQRKSLIAQIEEAPALLRAAISGLNEEQLNTPYRPGGWTVRQVVHHLPDSHLNGYIRFKMGLCKDQPTIQTYDQARWALFPDANLTPIETSLRLLETLHERWVILLSSLSEDSFRRLMDHPEIGTLSLDALLSLYSWHGRHHVAHITSLRSRMGW